MDLNLEAFFDKAWSIAVSARLSRSHQIQYRCRPEDLQREVNLSYAVLSIIDLRPRSV